jgi:hypothetical protein
VGPKVHGIVVGVDARRHTLTLNVKNTHLSVPDVPVAAQAKITVGGKDATLADLKPGMSVVLQMTAETDRSLIIGISTLKVVRRAP